MKIKLQEYLKRHGYANSNKDARRLIRDHTVTLNGIPLKSCSAMVSTEKSPSIQVSFRRNNVGANAGVEATATSTTENNNTDEERVQGGPLHRDDHSINMSCCCIVYNKPCGMICTQSPTETKLCLNDIVDPIIPDQYHPVGRLDQHSHGLLLFSSDGRLTSRLLSPNSAIERVYQIVVRGDVGDQTAVMGRHSNNAGSDHVGRRYEEICTLVEKGIQTDYGFFKGRIISMKRNVESNYEHSKCGVDCGGDRKDTFDTKKSHSYNQHQQNRYGGQTGLEADKCEVKPMLSLIVVAVQEGKKRMVRRLFAAMGLFVVGK
jgi:16S rRNA uridine-516 pseudouridylate synthase and related pseudouridylate synthases